MNNKEKIIDSCKSNSLLRKIAVAKVITLRVLGQTKTVIARQPSMVVQ